MTDRERWAATTNFLLWHYTQGAEGDGSPEALERACKALGISKYEGGTGIVAEVLERMMKAAATYFGVTSADILGHTRFPEHTKVRYALWAALHNRGWTKDRIGKATGRDRTTVRHGLRRAAYMCEHDAHFAAGVRVIGASVRKTKG